MSRTTAAALLAVTTAAAAAFAGRPAAPAQAQPGRVVRGPGLVIPITGCRGPGLPLPTPPPTPPPVPGAGGPGGLTYQACPQLTGRAPATVMQYALANPHAVSGYGLRRNPNVPGHPWNPYRTWLSLTDYGKPWNACNTVVWKAGCP
jgi:hypothetical protein